MIQKGQRCVYRRSSQWLSGTVLEAPKGYRGYYTVMWEDSWVGFATQDTLIPIPEGPISLDQQQAILSLFCDDRVVPRV